MQNRSMIHVSVLRIFCVVIGYSLVMTLSAVTAMKSEALTDFVLHCIGEVHAFRSS